MLTDTEMKTNTKPKNGTQQSMRRVVYRTSLVTLREQMGLTRMEVASRVGLTSEKMLSNAELGLGIRLDTAMKLARFYKRPVEQIWSLVTDAPRNERRK